MATLAVETPHGQANVHLHPAERPRGALVLGHGAGGRVSSRDLVAVTDAALEGRVSVALVVQGERDPFGIPPAAAHRWVVQVAGDHGLRSDLQAVAAAVKDCFRTS